MNTTFPEIRFGPQALANPLFALAREWLITDGAGSYASSSVLGCNTRRYHGLLVAAQRPPAERTVLLSQLKEEVVVDGVTHSLSTSEYPGVLHPEGYKHLARFRLAPLPEWTFSAGSAFVEKKIVPLRGRRAVAIRYRLVGPSKPVLLRLSPLVACHDFHGQTRPDAPFAASQGSSALSVVVRGGDRQLAVHLQASAGEFEPKPLRFHRVTYRREAERGLSPEDELFSPGAFSVELSGVDAFTLTASCDPQPPADFDAEERRECERLGSVLAAAQTDDPLERALTLAADAFIVGTGAADRAAIIAGYPWFDAWGRDACIALEGLTLATGRHDSARAVLLTFAERVCDGLVPNFLAAAPADDGLNSIDASLWFVHAAARYHACSSDHELMRDRLWPTIAGIVEAYAGGTRYGIGIGADGLVAGGSQDTQLTWMDAQTNGQPVTPRHGKAVEINALWYNALEVAASLAKRFDHVREQERYEKLARRVRDAFHHVFWSDAAQHLYDYVDGEHRDVRLRPNQILSISLPHAVLERSRWPAVLSAVTDKLYTPWGLRTLSPDDPAYRCGYGGGPQQRDEAYHQGVAWPWLLGPFYEAYLKTHEFSAAAREAVAAALSLWQGHLLDAGLGTVSEIFGGDPPHAPDGCIAQAWSVAELLRVCRLTRRATAKPLANPRSAAGPERSRPA